MPRTEATRYAFNRGLISPLAIARVDLKRAQLSAELQTNWMPRTMGSMMLRAGLGYLGNTASNAAARYIEFVRSLSAMHLLEFTNEAMRVWTDDALITRPSVSSVITGGDFPTAASLAADWTDSDDVGGTSAWQAGAYLGLTGNGTARAIRDKPITVAAADQNVEHALRVVIQRGPVVLRVGSTSGGDEYINEVTLGTGTHSLAFTPTGAIFYIRFQSALKRIVLVKSCNIEAAGVVSITSPYLTADLGNIRANTDSLSVDVMFVGCAGFQQRRIERRDSGRSWSIVLYQPDDGPFRSENVSATTMAPSVLSGNGTLTASTATFRSGHVGALFSIDSIGQTVSKSMTALNDATASILVTGVTTDRSFTIVLSGLTASGNTVILQRSFDNAIWTAVTAMTWTTDTTESYLDGLDNQIVYYRLICTVYAAGATAASLTINTGSIFGVVRVTAYTSATVVDIEVITELGGLTASDTWAEGLWSDYRGWPSSGALYEGRLCWGGYDAIVMSISDAFDGFDPQTEGDSGPINRTIGSGPMDVINWVLPLQRLILGAQLAEHSVRSNTFDEPITPTNFNRKRASKQGSAAVQAISLGATGMYVEKSGTRLMELTMDPSTADYTSNDMTILNPEVLQPRVVRMAVQMKPDIRLHCILSDGTAAVMVYDSAEQVKCWIKLETDGLIEDVVVLPATAGVTEDRVYYVVARTINSATVRFLEKWALESECQGSTTSKQADAFVTFTNNPASATVTGLTHLIGEEVVCWADGKCLKDADGDIETFTVSATGTITLTNDGASYTATTGMAGLAYRASFKTAKLGQTLSKHKTVDHLAPVLYNTHAQGLKMGPDFTTMDNLPLTYGGTAVNTDTVYAAYDESSQEFPGDWDVDARICLEANAPRPVTILAMTIEGQVNG